MRILSTNQLSFVQLSDIKELIQTCIEHEGLTDMNVLSNDLNFNQNLKCFHLMYVGDELVSAIIIFAPSPKEAEISAYTNPQQRKKGYFKLLLERAEKELRDFEIEKILFVCDSNAKDAQKVVDKWGASLSYSEYVMEYDKGFQFEKVPIDQDLHLKEANEMFIPEMIKINEDIFNESHEMTAKLISDAQLSERINCYLLLWDEKIIGVANVSKEANRYNIFGFGILQKYQNQGYGKIMLYLILSKLIRIKNSVITIELDTTYEKAYRLYHNNGFHVKTQFDYYQYNYAQAQKKDAPIATVK